MRSTNTTQTEEVAHKATSSALLIESIEHQLTMLKEMVGKCPQPDPKPRLALPRLLDDGSDIDLLDRSHIQLQTEQIIGVMKVITTPLNPLVHSTKIKEFILENFYIGPAAYWMAKSGPKETERWWKHIYDKAIERMDVQDGLIVRKNKTGKKGMYALTEFYVKAHAQQELDFQPLKIRLPQQRTPRPFTYAKFN